MLNTFLHKKISSVPVYAWLLLGALCLLGYWPISTNLFSLKNDAYIYFLPCRYFISETIRSGHLPLWNPYFYMGFPLHGDMQAGVWNPVILLFSLFGRYNMTMLQYETLLYIFIAGIGMYKLLDVFNTSPVTKIILAASYMFCGFIIDTGQITVWTGSAAFIPFVFLYYYRLLHEPEMIYKNALKTALAFYFLFTAGYPSFLIMCGYILFFALLFYFVSNNRKNGFNKNFTITLLKANALLLIAFLLISLPALLSYIDYFPYYQRSTGTSLSEAQRNPFNPFAIISYIFPLSVTRDNTHITTDPTARSGFIGLFSILFFAAFSKRKTSGLQKFVFVITVLIFLFSLGDAFPLRKFCYFYIPLMKFFRHPGTMRIFTTIGLLVLASFYLDQFFVVLKEKKTKPYLLVAVAFIILIGIIVSFNLVNNDTIDKLLSFKTLFTSGIDKRAFLKNYYSNFSFGDAILLEGSIQVFFLCIFILLLKRKKTITPVWFAGLFIFNPILLAQFSIPNTFVTQKSPAAINALIKASPITYPVPDINTSIAQNDSIEEASSRIYGCASFYTKKLVQVQEELNPSFTQSLRGFDDSRIISSTVLQYPVCYFADSTIHYKDSAQNKSFSKKMLYVDDSIETGSTNNAIDSNKFITIKQFTPWGLSFETRTTQSALFVLFQNYNKNWELLVDGEPVGIQKGNMSFMYANIKEGQHSLQFYYHPGYIFYAITISVISSLLILFFLVRNPDRKNIQSVL